MFSSTKNNHLFQQFRTRKRAPETLNEGATRSSGEGRKLDKSHSCPSCKKTFAAPGLTRDDPLFTALGGEVKDYAPEHADILCQETYTTVMPQVEYQTKCPACGKDLQVKVQDLEFKCSCTPDTTKLTTIISYKSFSVSKPESWNRLETRGLRAFLKAPEAAQAQFFLKVTHKDHVHAFCSRCGGPVMVTFHGLSSVQESFEFTCRQCGKHGNYKREPMDFEDKPLIENNRKNP